MNHIVNLKELREHMPKYAARVKKGESFLVMKRSKPLFRVAPVEHELWEEVIDFTSLKRGGVDIKELLARL